MMRAHHCMLCGEPMPPGSRIDRQYCRESCRTLACRTRKGKRGGAISATPAMLQRRTQAGTIERRPLSAFLELALRLEDMQAETQAELTAARQHIAQLETQAAKRDAERDATASQQIRQLQHDLQEANQENHQLRQQIEKGRHATQTQADACGRLTQELKEAQRSAHTQADLCTRLTQELKEAQRDAQTQADVCGRLTQEFKEARAQRDDLQRRHQRLTDEAEELRRRDKTLREQLDHALGRAQTAENKLLRREQDPPPSSGNAQGKPSVGTKTNMHTRTEAALPAPPSLPPKQATAPLKPIGPGRLDAQREPDAKLLQQVTDSALQRLERGIHSRSPDHLKAAVPLWFQEHQPALLLASGLFSHRLLLANEAGEMSEEQVFSILSPLQEHLQKHAAGPDGQQHIAGWFSENRQLLILLGRMVAEEVQRARKESG